MTAFNSRFFLISLLVLIATGANSKERHPGTAIIRINDSEYTIPIECNDPTRPELGFSTEPGR